MAEKLAPLDLALQRLEKKWGSGVVMDLENSPGNHLMISSGHPGIDRILGGGWPMGKIVELYGMESSGKTTLSLHAAANIQIKKLNTGRVGYIDYENSFDKYYAQRLGVKTGKDHFLIAQPDFAEQGLDIMNEFIEYELVDMLIVDSVAAMLPQSEMVDEEHGGSMGKTIIGSQSRVVSQALKQLASKLNKKRVLLVFINQIRTKIGQGKQKSSQTTTGGHALKFYASQRVELRKVKMQIEREKMVGMNVRVKVAKNKVAAPFGECDAVFRFGKGMDVTGSIVQALLTQKLLSKTKQGHWDLTKFGIEAHPRGDAGLWEFMDKNPELVLKFTEKVDWDAAAAVSARGASLEDGEEGGTTDTEMGGDSGISELLGQTSTPDESADAAA